MGDRNADSSFSVRGRREQARTGMCERRRFRAAVPVQPPSVRSEKQRAFGALAYRQVDRAGGARGERDGDDLAALAGDDQGPVPALEPEVLDVRTGGLGDPQPFQRQQGDERPAPSYWSWPSPAPPSRRHCPRRWPGHPLWSAASSACDGTGALPDVRPLGRVDGGAGIPDVQGGRGSRGKSRCWRGTSGFIPPDWRGSRLVP
jgi:hypothetical protein